MSDSVEIRLELPIPPTINHYYGYVNGDVRRKFITPEGKAFRHHVSLEVMIAGARDKFGKARLAVDIVLNMRSKAGDIDNRVKPLFDALEAANVFDNDRQIDVFHVKRGKIIKDGRAVVRIESITEL